MARTYWTFKIEIEDLYEKDSDLLIWQILYKVERNIGSLFFPLFFPIPGPGHASVRKRAKTQKSQLEFFAPNMDINRFIYENPILDYESKRSLLSFLWRIFTKTWLRAVSARKARHRQSFAQTPKWYKLMPNPGFRPSKSKVTKLEEVRIRYDISHEHFAFFVTSSPATTRNLQYVILRGLKVKHPDLSDNELWTMLLKGRSLARLNRGGAGISDYEIERIVSNASTLEDICNYIIMLDLKERGHDPIGIEKAIIKAIEG